MEKLYSHTFFLSNYWIGLQKMWRFPIQITKWCRFKERRFPYCWKSHFKGYLMAFYVQGRGSFFYDELIKIFVPQVAHLKKCKEGDTLQKSTTANDRFPSPEIPSSLYCLSCGLEIDYCRSNFILVAFHVCNQFSQHLSTLAERHLCTLAAN